jgi:hypothetical protein
MFESVVTIGDKLHVITRRLFDGDLRRHFMGEVVGNTGSLVELEGYVVVFDEGSGEWVRLPETRRRVFSLAEAGHVVNRVPRGVEIDKLMYERIDGELLVTDGREFELNINEFGPRA